MRKRWMVGLLVVLLAILGGRAVSMAQRPRPIVLAVAEPQETKPEPKRWTPSPKVASPADVPPPMLDGPPMVPGEVKAADPVGPAPDDPMAAVDTFLDRNRKEADESIKALTREAEALKARLQKVEAALARWQGVSNALNPNPIQPAAAPTPDPTQLAPIKPPEPPRAPELGGIDPSPPPPTVRPTDRELKPESAPPLPLGEPTPPPPIPLPK